MSAETVTIFQSEQERSKKLVEACNIASQYASQDEVHWNERFKEKLDVLGYEMIPWSGSKLPSDRIFAPQPVTDAPGAWPKDTIIRHKL